MKDILYTVALDNKGDLIKASEADKGMNFYCSLCKGELILHKSGKIGKGSKRPHFAHLNLTPNCNPETALHLNFKNMLAKKLQQNLETNEPLHFSWKCKYCYEEHSGNLLKKINNIKLEYNLCECIPDIALFDNQNNIFAVIEIVVTHKPEEKTLQFYKDNNIIMIQINLESDKDIDEIDIKMSNPDFVQFCFNPKCSKCGFYMQKTIMIIGEQNCYRCNSKMKFAIIDGGEERECIPAGPDKFLKHELEYAQSKGVLIMEQYSKTANERYLAITCRYCGTFVGKFFLYTLEISDESKLLKKQFGYHCDHCYELEMQIKENI